MITVSTKNKTHNYNYSDDKLTLKELCVRCQSLEIQQSEMLKLKKDLLVLNEKNETTSERLLKLKTDFELYKSRLDKTLYNLNVSINKQRILSRKKLDDFFKKRKAFEEYYKMSPVKQNLEKLINENKILEEECKYKSELLQLTKKQYKELVHLVFETLKKKVFEFCNAVLRLKACNN